MKINRDNYELYFLDFFDGELSEEKQAALFAFLKQHPDLKTEFEAFEDIHLQAPEISMPDKQALKKSSVAAAGPVDDTNYVNYVIASVEGDLSAREAQHLDAFLHKNPHLKREAALYRKTKLTPDKRITFSDKQQLRKNPLLVHFGRRAYWYGAAASIALLIAVFFPNLKTDHGLQPIARVASCSYDFVHHSRAIQDPEMRTVPAPAYDDQPVPVRKSLEPLPQMASLQGSALPVTRRGVQMHKRMEMTSLFLYDQLEEDLEYYAMLRDYSQKSLLERVTYQLKNRIAGDGDMYVTDPELSRFNLNAESLTAVNDFSFTDIFSEKKHDKPRNKDYHFKSDLIEISRSKGE